jgi:hypothetical protein
VDAARTSFLISSLIASTSAAFSLTSSLSSSACASFCSTSRRSALFSSTLLLVLARPSVSEAYAPQLGSVASDGVARRPALKALKGGQGGQGGQGERLRRRKQPQQAP